MCNGHYDYVHLPDRINAHAAALIKAGLSAMYEQSRLPGGLSGQENTEDILNVAREISPFSLA